MPSVECSACRKEEVLKREAEWQRAQARNKRAKKSNGNACAFGVSCRKTWTTVFGNAPTVEPPSAAQTRCQAWSKGIYLLRQQDGWQIEGEASGKRYTTAQDAAEALVKD